MEIKHGFIIDGDKIFDTKIQAYEMSKRFVGNNLIYTMKPSKYKRLYRFEPLLDKYDLETVFKILKCNTYIQKQRKVESLIKINKLHYISNMAMIYNYPPSFLTQKKFALYKICQTLKKRLD